ncbi:MipA/OmpV family protein [Mitsuaria sp. GD03876]|uniref:MipA/OmpV family protein n=1 Tax=Mitsuaria sp. GD03876 TaxID=2975399 RepID=UPI002448447D|nr:MipA/OmpV family protein [Mitsuaria sp. GD03876]MDH0865008.1 MipA/OmpV family protein [Mitsuaria sp. GD03876]
MAASLSPLSTVLSHVPAPRSTIPVHPVRLGAALLALSLAALAAPVRAQAFGDADPEVSSSTQWGLGIGFASRQRPYAEADRKNSVIPVLYVENRWFRLAGGSADAKLWRHQFAPGNSLSASLRLKYDDEGYKASDSPLLAGMDKRKASFLGGGALTWTTPWVELGAEWLSDVSSESKGQKLSLQAEHRFGVGEFGVRPRVKAQWLDKKYVDYYYGVRAHEVAPGRALYTGESAMTTELGLRVDYAIARRHVVFIDASVTRLPDEIRQSPIVSRKNTSRVALGYLYRF